MGNVKLKPMFDRQAMHSCALLDSYMLRVVNIVIIGKEE